MVEHRRVRESRDAFDAELAERIERHRADVVALAGFMRILGAEFVRHFDGRLVNIHPSLLPAFPGLTRTRARSRPAARRVARRVHFVTADLDHGPIIGQAVVPVLADDTEAILAARVLVQEHVLYPLCDPLARRGLARPARLAESFSRAASRSCSGGR